MKRQIQNQKLLFILVGIIALMEIGLGALQFRWTDGFFYSVERRLTKTLVEQTDQALASVQMEIEVLFYILRLSPDEIERDDYIQFNENLNLWKNSTEFESILKSIYLIPPKSNSNDGSLILKWNEVDGKFLPIDNYDFKDELLLSYQKENSSEQKEIEELLNQNGLFYISFWKQDEPLDFPKLFIEVDNELFITKILPFYLTETLSDNPFEIRKKNSSEILYTQGDLSPGQSPEIIHAISKSKSLILQPPWSKNSDGNLSGNILMDIWKTQTKQQGWGALPINDEYELLVYHSGGPVHEGISFQRRMNYIIIIGFQVLFLLTLTLLFYLYRKTQMLLLKEQNFVASMGHELRSPIAVIQASADTLGRNIVTDPERILKYASIMSQQAKRLSENVESILFYSGMEDNSIPPYQRQSWSLSEFVSQAAKAQEILISGKKGTLDLQIDSNIMTNLNPHGVRLIIDNLLSNAVKHGISKESEVSGLIRIKLYRGEFTRSIVFSVSDNGQGITPRERKKIFNPFFRGRMSMNNQVPGNGLGLYLVSRTIELLGGTVIVESPIDCDGYENSRGSRFIIHLPSSEE